MHIAIAAWGVAPPDSLLPMEEKTHGAQEKQNLYRRRREEAVNRLVAEARASPALGEAALEEGDETEAGPYREAEELARDLYRGR